MTNFKIFKKDNFRAVDKGAFRDYRPLRWSVPAFKDPGLNCHEALGQVPRQGHEAHGLSLTLMCVRPVAGVAQRNQHLGLKHRVCTPSRFPKSGWLVGAELLLWTHRYGTCWPPDLFSDVGHECLCSRVHSVHGQAV